MSIDPRCAQYKDRILSAPYEICIERARFVTQSYRETEDQPKAIRAAKAFAHTVKHVSIHIEEMERIAGWRSSKVVGTVIPVERGEMNLILELELDALLQRERQPYRIDEADRRELQQEILPYWRGNTLRDYKNRLWRKNGLFFRPAVNPASLLRRVKALNLKRLKETTAVPGVGLDYAFKGIQAILYNNIALVMNAFDVQGHLILGHRSILEKGFGGVKKEALQRLELARKKGDERGKEFLQAVIICCDAMRELAERYAVQAERQAQHCLDMERRYELEQIAKRCRKVPYEAPRNFKEAVQTIWFTHVGALLAHGMAGIFATGRLDQHLNAFYEADLAAGRIDETEARAWIEELLLKLSSGLLLLPFAGKQTSNELGADSCSPTIGGVGRDGEDAVNPTTYLILEAYENVRSTGNSFMIRLSKKNPQVYWERVLASYRHTSGAALFNDEVTIPALHDSGMSIEDARDYGLIGCVEPTGDGDTFGCTSGNDISLVAALEMALNDGYLTIMGRRIGPKTGDARRFTHFEELLTALERQITFMVRTVVKAVNLKDLAYMEKLPNPFVSMTLKGCVESARDMTHGGAKYNYGSMSGRGLGTVADSLAAIEQFVFTTHELSMDKLLKMLATNFKGQEIWRRKLMSRAPVYGADDEQVDRLAKRVAEFFCQQVSEQQTIRGGPFRPSFFSYGMHVLDGLLLAATPDGRLAGEPISNSFSPSNGSERQGPTGVFRSLARIDQSRISNGCALNVKLTPSMFEGAERLKKMTALFQTYFTEGGMEISPNVVSNQMLKAAQADPEAYRDLVVRVSGYSAYFTDLGRPLQDEIISRTAFERV